MLQGDCKADLAVCLANWNNACFTLLHTCLAATNVKAQAPTRYWLNDGGQRGDVSKLCYDIPP
jgi:hypothetical protein